MFYDILSNHDRGHKIISFTTVFFRFDWRMHFGADNIKFNSETIKNRVKRAKGGSQMIIKKPTYKTEPTGSKDREDSQWRKDQKHNLKKL